MTREKRIEIVAAAGAMAGSRFIAMRQAQGDRLAEFGHCAIGLFYLAIAIVLDKIIGGDRVG